MWGACETLGVTIMKRVAGKIEDSADDKERKIIKDEGKLVEHDNMKLRRGVIQESFKYYMRAKEDNIWKTALDLASNKLLIDLYKDNLLLFTIKPHQNE